MKSQKTWATIMGTVIVLLLPSCFSTNKISVQNLSNQYRPDEHYLRPEFTLYNINDSISLVYFKVDEGNLLFVRRLQADSFSAAVSINCKVTASYDDYKLEDTNTVVLKFSSISNSRHELAVGSIPLKMKAGAIHLLTITTTDLYSKKEDINYIDADKISPDGGQNFMLRDPSNGYVVFSRYIDSAVTYAVMYSHPVQRYYVNYYHRNFPTAAPPFATVESSHFVYKPDSSFVLPAGSSGAAFINLKKEGFYHIQVDTNSREGITLYRFPKYFPNIGEAGQMASPLRYITTNEEYERVVKAKNVKQAVDEFWINTAGNAKERAKSLIRNYYNRVQDANKFFTSYEEGWKTDRGMVYVVYGPPSIIFRNTSSEVWTYGEDRNYTALSFTFVKTNNPFTDNDYTLQREAQLRNLWYNAVDIWREGRVY